MFFYFFVLPDDGLVSRNMLQ